MPTINFKEENRKWWVLLAMSTSMSMIFVDTTVLPVALPTMQRHLNLSNLNMQWIINAYNLVLAAFVLGCGRLADIWGLKRAFGFGLFCFAFASALCGLSPSANWIVAGRALQGIGGAILIPTTQGIIYSTFPPQQRGKAVGISLNISAIFLILGPLIGGSITEYLGWRFIFWINLPISLLGYFLMKISVPNFNEVKEPFDLAGFIVLAISIAAIIIPLMQVQVWGWQSPLTLSFIAFGCILLWLFFKVEGKINYPLIDISILSKRFFQAGSGSIFCIEFVMMITIFWMLFLQKILYFSPIQAGSFCILFYLPMLFAAPFGGYLVDKFGPRLPVMLGFGLILFSLLLFINIQIPTNYMILLFVFIPFGFGFPLIYTPSYISIFNEVAIERRGNTAGMIATIRQFSSTLGLAIFGTLFTSREFSLLNQILKSSPHTAHISPPQLQGLLSQSSKALENISSLSPSQIENVLAAARTAYVSSFMFLNSFACLIAAIGFVIVWRFMKNYPIHY